jgi:hypothetical protein
MSHIIDNSDHWEHEDKSISRLNVLKFNEKVFGLISPFNPLDYQNRLRHFQYIELLKRAGFKIEFDGFEPDKIALNDLQSINICKRYRDVSHEELAILTSYIAVASKDTIFM